MQHASVFWLTLFVSFCLLKRFWVARMLWILIFALVIIQYTLKPQPEPYKSTLKININERHSCLLGPKCGVEMKTVENQCLMGQNETFNNRHFFEPCRTDRALAEPPQWKYVFSVPRCTVGGEHCLP